MKHYEITNCSISTHQPRATRFNRKLSKLSVSPDKLTNPDESGQSRYNNKVQINLLVFAENCTIIAF